MSEVSNFEELSKLIRYYILKMTTAAQSGHVTSSFSATELMVSLFFGKLNYDLGNPKNPLNDKVIFSKGHASPLLWALYTAAGEISEKDLESYRQLGSVLEGHPTPRFKHVDVATGSLGQGLGIGVGMAMGASALTLGHFLTRDQRSFDTLHSGLRGPNPKIARSKATSQSAQVLPNIYVLLGDSEMAEGSVWEAMEVASFYKLSNLVAILDVNRLGQSTETMLGWDTDTYKKRAEAFGWDAQVIDGHDFDQIQKAFEKEAEKPRIIIAKTIKGKGISFLENKEGWHGKALDEGDYKKAIGELGDFDKNLEGKIKYDSLGPVRSFPDHEKSQLSAPKELTGNLSTRKAYGLGLAALGESDERIIALDGETSNSTFSEIFREKFPQRYFEMFIAEQNMVSVALGLSKYGYVPFVSTFATFFTRAYDQIRMSANSSANIKFVGSHCGVSIGEDGPSQMGLQDLALFRSFPNSYVFYPADGVSTFNLVRIAKDQEGIVYIRTNRPETPALYKNEEEFTIGGSKVLRSSKEDRLTIVSCGVTLFESLEAADVLAKKGINVRVVDAYSVKPIDKKTLISCARETGGVLLTVEDHYMEGGLGDAVLEAVSEEGNISVFKMGVSTVPVSGKWKELLDFCGISAKAVTQKVEQILKP